MSDRGCLLVWLAMLAFCLLVWAGVIAGLAWAL